MSPPILVTGAGGFVGSAVAEALLAAGHPVLATDLAFDAPARARLHGARLVEAPLAQALADLSGTAPAAVVHAAAITADPAGVGLTPAAHLQANVGLVLEALGWARGQGARRFVFLSSSGVFGAAHGGAPVDEAAAPCATDPYSAAKRAGEILLAGAAEPDFQTAALRLGPVYGPHEAVRPTRPRLSPVARMIDAARTSGEIVLATPEACRDWTFLPDIARAIAALLAAPAPLPVLAHLTSGAVVSDIALAEAIARLIPGTTVRAAPDPAAPPPRPAMVSTHPAMAGLDWTPLAEGLSRLLPATVQA